MIIDWSNSLYSGSSVIIGLPPIIAWSIPSLDLITQNVSLIGVYDQDADLVGVYDQDLALTGAYLS